MVKIDHILLGARRSCGQSKREHANAQDCSDKYDENMGKAYIIFYHQCSPTLKNDLKASDKFATISRN